MRMALSGSPGTNSIAMKQPASDSPNSWTAATCGWVKAARARASPRRRARLSGARAELVVDDLDGDIAIERDVAGAVDLAHPAGPEQSDDLVGSESGTDRQAHQGAAIIAAGSGILTATPPDPRGHLMKTIGFWLAQVAWITSAVLLLSAAELKINEMAPDFSWSAPMAGRIACRNFAASRPWCWRGLPKPSPVAERRNASHSVRVATRFAAST